MRELDNEASGGKGKGLTLLEEYDPEDEVSEMAVSRPWAFVCDCVRVLPTWTVALQEEIGGSAARGATGGAPLGPGVEKGKRPEESGVATVVKGPALSMNVTELIAQGPGSTPKAWDALADLRDKIAEGEKIDWWVIYNGDPDRAYDITDDSGYDEEESEDASVVGEQSEEISEDPHRHEKSFVAQDEAMRQTSPVREPRDEARMERRAQSSSKPKGMPPPPIPPAKDRNKGKRMPGMRAFPPAEKAMPPVPVSTSMVKPPPTKTETGLKKKFFGKR